MKKRGISPLISWVLLVGFVVGLSLMVTTWVKQQAESSSEKLVKNVESDIRCNDLAFNANLDCTLPTQPELTITNRGKFVINKLRLRQPGNSYDLPLELSVTKTMKIKPEDLKSFDPSFPADVIPIIILEGKDVICTARKLVISC